MLSHTSPFEPKHDQVKLTKLTLANFRRKYSMNVARYGQRFLSFSYGCNMEKASRRSHHGEHIRSVSEPSGRCTKHGVGTARNHGGGILKKAYWKHPGDICMHQAGSNEGSWRRQAGSIWEISGEHQGNILALGEGLEKNGLRKCTPVWLCLPYFE